MEREVRYCTTKDGVRIGYCVEGEGPPLVIAPYLLESFSLHNLYPSFADFTGQLRQPSVVLCRRADYMGGTRSSMASI